MFRKKHDLAVSSRSSEFNVDISVVNMHLHINNNNLIILADGLPVLTLKGESCKFPSMYISC